MQTENFICLLHIQIWAGIHVEGRQHTFNPSTPPLPSPYIKSRGEFLQEKGAATTALKNIYFSISPLKQLRSPLTGRIGRGMWRERKEGMDLSDGDTQGIFILVQYFC